MTLKMMAYFGIEYNWNSQTIQIKEQQYQAKNICIENDWSAVTFWLEIVAIAKKAQIKLNGLYKDSWQGDIKALSIFSKLGVNYQFKNNQLILYKEPKQIPKKGILFFLAKFIAAIFPSVPLLPKPPGIKIPDISLNLFLISLAFKKSDSILTKLTFKLFAIPP